MNSLTLETILVSELPNCNACLGPNSVWGRGRDTLRVYLAVPYQNGCPIALPFQPVLSHRLYSSLKEVQFFPAVPWGMKDTEQRMRILPRNQGLGIFCDTLILPSLLCHSLSSIKIIFCVLTGHLLFHFDDSSSSVPFLFIHLSLKKILRHLWSSHTHTNTHTKWSYFCALWRGKKKSSKIFSLQFTLGVAHSMGFDKMYNDNISTIIKVS